MTSRGGEEEILKGNDRGNGRIRRNRRERWGEERYEQVGIVGISDVAPAAWTQETRA